MSWNFKSRSKLDAHRVVFFWDGAATKHSALSQVLASRTRPPKASVLLANVYVEDEERFLGTAVFSLEELCSNKEVSSWVKRHGNSSSAGTLTLSGYVPPAASRPFYSDWVTEYALGGGGFPKLRSIAAHKKSWESLKMARRETSRFRMPFWQFGPNFAVPGWMFTTYEPVQRSPLSACERAAEIAMARTGASMSDLRDMTDVGLAALAWYHGVYCHCIPYSLEEDPRRKGKPSEYFAPPSLRDTGDCEDVSWAVGNSCRELRALAIPSAPRHDALRFLKAMNDQYHPFMVLGASTDASPDQRVKTGTIMAHMYVLMIPYRVLRRAGLDLPQYAPAPENQRPSLPILLVEGTGTVWPVQREGSLPPFLRGAGKTLSDSLIRKSKKGPPVRRVIHSPGTAENEHRVAEFYLDVVSGVSPYPDVGMYAFVRPDGKVGPLLSALVSEDFPDFKLVYIEGTNQTDPKYSGEHSKIRRILRLHEPTMPRYVSNSPIKRGYFVEKLKGLSSSRIGVRQDASPLSRSGFNNQTRFFFSAQAVGTPREERFVSGLASLLDKSDAQIDITTHSISGVGSYMIDVYFN